MFILSAKKDKSTTKINCLCQGDTFLYDGDLGLLVMINGKLVPINLNTSARWPDIAIQDATVQLVDIYYDYEFAEVSDDDENLHDC